MNLGQRIMIIGSGGAGKSTLARRLGELTDLPVIHLDAEHWQPGWVEPPREAWIARVRDMAARARWIIDGNYGYTIELRLQAADTVIFLDYPPLLCVWRVFRRWLQYRGTPRPDIGPGCPEKIDWQFLQWIYRYPRRSKPRVMALLEQYRERMQVVILSSPRETECFLAQLANEE